MGSKKYYIIFNLCAFALHLHALQPQLKTTPTPTLESMHCSQAAVLQGHITRANPEATEISFLSTAQLRLRLKETACFTVEFPNKNSSLQASLKFPSLGNDSKFMFTIQYSALEHQHPIRQRYEFGIPQIFSQCVCDCAGGVDHCPAGYTNQRCPHSRSACYSSFHAHQKAVGCPIGSESKLCCDIWIRPYKDWHFWALNLGHPEPVSTFTFKLFSQSNGEKPVLLEKNQAKVMISKEQLFKFENNQLEIRINGKEPGRKLHEGMYFARKNETSIRHTVPVYQQNDYSGLHKLGWFRFHKNAWSVRKGKIKVPAAHKVHVLNCKNQTYIDAFNAEYFVRKFPQKSELDSALGIFAEDFDPWIKKTFISQSSRQVIVSHRYGPPLTLEINLNNAPKIQFFHHQSLLDKYSGKILLDKHSNRFLNLTFYNSKGEILGTIHNSDQKEADHHEEKFKFSLFVPWSSQPKASLLFPLPKSFNGSRFICLHAKERVGSEICQWIQFYAKPLQWFELPKGEWKSQKGDCVGCNELNLKSFLNFLNPKQWVNGISNISELAAVGTDIFSFVFIVILLFLCFRCCVCPMSKMWFYRNRKH